MDSLFWRKRLFGLIALALVGCNNSKVTQCQQLITIANQVSRQTQEMINQTGDLALETQQWSQAARLMNQAAENITSLSLQDPQLREYQNSLVKMFRLYAQATDDAVQARADKNLVALKAANETAQKAGLLQEKLVSGINSYCLGEAIVK
ncbi:MAG TPA: hypothetical protein ACFCUY_00720 [Xenococcaceae cyanobacterium]